MAFIYTFINSKFGLLFNYIELNGSYINIKTLNQEINISVNNDQYNKLLFFSLTKSILNLQYLVFSFPNYLSGVVNENTSLDFIRIHYISFIKLYNKNMDFKTKLGDMNNIVDNSNIKERRKIIKALIRDMYNDQNFLQTVLTLCKAHLNCLFALAKNRSLDVTNKFFQLKILDFLVKEIDLEYEAAHKIQKYQSGIFII